MRHKQKASDRGNGVSSGAMWLPILPDQEASQAISTIFILQRPATVPEAPS